ncbi:DNA polymerase iota-like [Myiozetetes cayanensis]|uniref:DNA polymerase iota-like n=1 Tax=Myiozetetes cayanensis TaxID=478635 RepID=UPI00215E9A9D|nr:DNA polymerase iota-like [Myiozetetes cayanensis]
MEERDDEEWDDEEEEEELEELRAPQGDRVIVHLDLDCFYAQVEMLRNPDLKTKPLGVQQKSLVVTCNYEARKFGIRKLMGIREAKEKCPQLVLVKGEDLTPYREMSNKVTGKKNSFFFF